MCLVATPFKLQTVYNENKLLSRAQTLYVCPSLPMSCIISLSPVCVYLPYLTWIPHPHLFLLHTAASSIMSSRSAFSECSLPDAAPSPLPVQLGRGGIDGPPAGVGRKGLMSPKTHGGCDGAETRASPAVTPSGGAKSVLMVLTVLAFTHNTLCQITARLFLG